MEVAERMWEVMEEFGITVDLMLTSKTENDRETYFYQAVSSRHQVQYLLGLEAHIQGQNYNKEVTPGNEEEIMELLEELQDEREEQELNQDWLEENSDDLEMSLQELMAEQDFLLDDLETTKEMLEEQIESQQSYLDIIQQLQGSEDTTEDSSKDVLMDESYIQFLTTMFSILLFVGLLFSIVTGGVCAYCCSRKFCQNKGSYIPQREANTIDMQVVNTNSPPVSPGVRLPGQGSQQPQFGLKMKRTEQ